MSPLAGRFQTFLVNTFAPLYLDGAVISVTTEYDEVGEITSVETELAAKVQVDSMTEAMRGQDNASDQDRRILILATSDMAVDTDGIIRVDQGPYAGSRWLIMNINSDPTLSYYECRCRRQP